MTPILDKLKEKALAPFREDIPVDTGTTVVRGEDTLILFSISTPDPQQEML